MRSVNKVILIGNLTRAPEMRETPNGQSVTTFGIATNRQWVTKGSEKKNSAEFHECVAWARLAEICTNFLKKGHLVYVEGYLKTRSWDTPEGVKKFKTEVVVQDMILLEKRQGSDDDMEYSSTKSEETPAEETKEEVTKEEETPEETPAEETPAEEPKEETSEETPAAAPAGASDTSTSEASAATDTTSEPAESNKEADDAEETDSTQSETPEETPSEEDAPQEESLIDKDLGL